MLSRGGADAVVLREFDLASHDFVAAGFDLPEAKGGAAWLDRDTLLLSSAWGEGMTAFGEGMATSSGYARTVRLWRRGTDPLAAPVIFATDAANMAVWADLDREAADGRVVFSERLGFFDETVWIGDREGPKTRLDLPTDASAEWHRGWLAVKRRTPWTIAGDTHPPDTVLGMSLSAFLAGDRHFTKLFEPAERRALQGFFWCGDSLVLSILDDLKPMFEALTPSVAGWSRERITGLPEFGVANVWPLDVRTEESNGDLLASAQDPLTPASLFLVRPAAAPELLKRAPQTFDASGLVVTRHEAISADGARIPYTQVGPPGETGEAPVHLSGYGGFGISMLPYYNPTVGKLWLERGGTGVVANIRGGGEFGTAWHEHASRAARRQAPVARRFRRGRRRPRAPRGDAAPAYRRRGRVEWRHSDHQYADPLSRAVRGIVLHHPADRHAPLCEIACRRQLDRRIRRPRQPRGLAVPERDIRLSHGAPRPGLPADPDRDEPARRPRPPRPCPQDGGEIAGDGL